MNVWFTSSLSTNMGGKPSISFPGIYACEMDGETGQCNGSPRVVGDELLGGRKGINLSNLVMNQETTEMYALHAEDLFHILVARSEGQALLRSHFKIGRTVYTNREGGYDCNNYDTRFIYNRVTPVAFTLDADGETFISWEGYFQDCEDPDQASNGAVWSFGVSQVNSTCTGTGGLSNFDDCTTPVSVFFRGYVGKSKLLNSGIAISNSSSNRRLFYLTGIDRSNAGAQNAVWVMPDGIHTNPYQIPTPDLPTVSGYEALKYIEGVGSLRVALDSSQRPRAFCQTFYDHGVFCYELRVLDDGKDLNIASKMIFSSGDQVVSESCTLKDGVGVEPYMSPTTTGIDVHWDSSSFTPDLIVFGCYGGIAENGNMTTIFPDGRFPPAQTLPGAHSGSIVFGGELPRLPSGIPSDCCWSPLFGNNGITTEPRDQPNGRLMEGIILGIVLSIAVIVAVCWRWRFCSRQHEPSLPVTISPNTEEQTEVPKRISFNTSASSFESFRAAYQENTEEENMRHSDESSGN